jgi:Apoptosis regulator proteins, Bcl-2 family
MMKCMVRRNFLQGDFATADMASPTGLVRGNLATHQACTSTDFGVATIVSSTASTNMSQGQARTDSSFPVPTAAPTTPSRFDAEGDVDERAQVERDAIRLLDDLIIHVIQTPVSDVGAMADVCGQGDINYQRCRDTMLRIINELLVRYGAAFADMTSRLQLDTCLCEAIGSGDVAQVREAVEVCHSSLDIIVRDMLSDERLNWGRVAVVYAFASWVARYCCHNNAHLFDGQLAQMALLDQLKNIVSRIIIARLTPWIACNGGWVRYVFVLFPVAFRMLYCWHCHHCYRQCFIIAQNKLIRTSGAVICGACVCACSVIAVSSACCKQRHPDETL